MRSKARIGHKELGFSLQLFVAGTTPKSQQAIRSIKEMCDEEFGSFRDLEIIDIHQQPKLASSEDIIAVPTLVRKSPSPIRRLVGDTTEANRVLAALEIKKFKGLVH